MNNYHVHTASEELRDQYRSENDKGNGVGVGDETQTIEEAVAAEGWIIVESYADSLATAIDPQGNQYIVGGDGGRRNAWAVSAK